jgi:aspartate/methionine/tyrosine aminotransferase
MRFHAPYMEWAKKRPAATFDLAGSNVLSCSIDDLEGARDALALSGSNDNGYPPLVEAIARRYGVRPEQVATANGAAGANFQVCAAVLEPGDDVLMERPGYDPLLGSARLLGANVVRFERRFEDDYALDPDEIARALTPRTRLIILTSPHNPTGALADRAALEAIGQMAVKAGAHVLVDEVYLDAADAELRPAALLGAPFISTSSLTKSYGLSSLRCGWSLSSTAVAERVRRARDVIDGSGSIATERLATLAFAQLDRLEVRTTALLGVNRPLVHEFLRGRRELEVVLPRNSTVVFPRIRGVRDTGAFAERLLAERGTAIVPGRFFEAPAHFRLGFGGPGEVVEAGLAQLGAALDAL